MVKKLLTQLLIIITLTTIVQSCLDKIIEKDYAILNEIFFLKETQTMDLYQGGQYVMTVTADSIADSRCPNQAVCFSPGSANVQLQITGIQEIAQQVELCMGDACLDTPHENMIMVDGISYRITLVNVTPYPVVGDNNPEKTAMLVITQ